MKLKIEKFIELDNFVPYRVEELKRMYLEYFPN